MHVASNICKASCSASATAAKLVCGSDWRPSDVLALGLESGSLVHRQVAHLAGAVPIRVEVVPGIPLALDLLTDAFDGVLLANGALL